MKTNITDNDVIQYCDIIHSAKFH